MKSKKTKLLLLTLFIILIGAVYFFETQNRNQKNVETSEALEQPKVFDEATQKPVLEDPSIDTSNALSEVKSNEEQFEEALAQCLDLNTFVPVKTPEELIQLLKSQRTRQNVLIENYHLQLPNNEERRIHLIANEKGDSSQGRELRYFKLDAQGLPQLIPLKPKESINPDAKVLEKFLQQGQIIYHQSKESWILNDNSNLEIEFQNEKIYEFQYQLHGKIFSCRDLDCQCSGI